MKNILKERKDLIKKINKKYKKVELSFFIKSTSLLFVIYTLLKTEVIDNICLLGIIFVIFFSLIYNKEIKDYFQIEKLRKERNKILPFYFLIKNNITVETDEEKYKANEFYKEKVLKFLNNCNIGYKPNILKKFTKKYKHFKRVENTSEEIFFWYLLILFIVLFILTGKNNYEDFNKEDYISSFYIAYSLLLTIFFIFSYHIRILLKTKQITPKELLTFFIFRDSPKYSFKYDGEDYGREIYVFLSSTDLLTNENIYKYFEYIKKEVEREKKLNKSIEEKCSKLKEEYFKKEYKDFYKALKAKD